MPLKNSYSEKVPKISLKMSSGKWQPSLSQSHYMVTLIWVVIGSVNGLVPDGTESLHEPKLTYHLRCSVALTLQQFNKEYY